MAKDNPELAKRLNTNDTSSQNLNEAAKRLASSPEISAALARHNLASQDFLLTQRWLMQASFAVMAKKAGATQERRTTESHVNSPNITFVEQHEAELEALRSKYQGQNKDSADQT